MLRWLRFCVMALLGALSPRACSGQAYCNARMTMAARFSAPASTPQANVDTTDLTADIVRQVNSARHMYDAPDLTWNVTLAALAETEAVACGEGAGNGVASAFATDVCEGMAPDRADVLWQRCIGGWFAESLHFDFSKPDITSDTANFINLVWNTTRQLGCGDGVCASGWRGVCLFDTGLPSPTSLSRVLP